MGRCPSLGAPNTVEDVMAGKTVEFREKGGDIYLSEELVTIRSHGPHWRRLDLAGLGRGEGEGGRQALWLAISKI